MTSRRTLNARAFHSNICCIGPTSNSKKTPISVMRGALAIAVLATLLPIVAHPAQAQTETVLYNFTGGNDGSGPKSSLTLHGDNFYGTTVFGGLGEGGTVFELFPNGSGGWNETVLYAFCSLGTGGQTCPDGGYPTGPIVFDSVGNLYGMTPEGGNTNCGFTVGCGVAFELSPVGAGWTETVLYAFCSQFSGGECHDGDDPGSYVTIDAAGNLYGEVAAGPFELSPSGEGWTQQILSATIRNSISGLTMDAAGNIFGPSSSSTGQSIVFELSPKGKGGWNTTVIYTFTTGLTGSGTSWSPLTVDAAGNLYGTVTKGAVNNNGEVFKLSPGTTGYTETVLFNFSPSSSASTGNLPSGGLVLDAAGNIYGTTMQGGTYGQGTVFELVAPVGTGKYEERTLWSFNGSDGSQPVDGLILDSAGNLYGTTYSGGSGNSGVAFEVTTSASTTTTLVSSLNPSFVGQAVTFTATVSSTNGTPPNGETITFFSGSTVLGTASLSSGMASLTISSMAAGIYTITASYPGDASFAASTSPGLRQVVNSTTKTSTATTLSSSLNPSVYGQSVTWTATVTTAGSTPPTGKVNFTWETYTIGSATLNSSGVATFTRSNLNADSYPLTAVYQGDANNLGSTSPVVNQVVTEATSSAALTSSPNPSTSGEAVTFTATITSPTAKPTGPVTFAQGKTVLGTAQLSGGKAKFTSSTLAVGSTTISATYSGDSNISESSTSVTQTVQQ